MLPGWAIARPGLHFAHPGNVERPTQTRGYFCIMNYNRKNNENLILENSKYIVWLLIYLQITMIYFVSFVLTSFECFKNNFKNNRNTFSS